MKLSEQTFFPLLKENAEIGHHDSATFRYMVLNWKTHNSVWKGFTRICGHILLLFEIFVGEKIWSYSQFDPLMVSGQKNSCP